MSEWQETEIGNIPSDWALFTVGELVEKDFIEKPLDGNHGGIHPKGSDFVPSGIPFIMATDVGDIKTPYIMLTPQVTYYRVKNREKLNNAYLKYFFDSPVFQDTLINHGDSGSTRAYVGITAQRELPIAIPNDINEQKAIAAVLSSLDDKIDLLHRQNKTLEAMADTLFKQWFIEEAQEDWESGSLGDVIEIFDSQRVPLSKMERDKKKDGILYPYYGAAQIMDYINDYIFDGEYILLGEDGTVRTDEGYPVLQFATGKFWVNNHAHVLKAKEPYSNFFVWNFLSKKNIDEIVTGAVQPKINQANLKSLDFPRYPTGLVEDFNLITTPMLDKIHGNKSQIRTLEKLRDTLLPKLMSGEIRVTP